MKSQTAPPPTRCPRCNAPLGRDRDGLACLCGWHDWATARQGAPRIPQTSWRRGRHGEPEDVDDAGDE